MKFICSHIMFGCFLQGSPAETEGVVPRDVSPGEGFSGPARFMAASPKSLFLPVILLRRLSVGFLFFLFVGGGAVVMQPLLPWDGSRKTHQDSGCPQRRVVFGPKRVVFPRPAPRARGGVSIDMVRDQHYTFLRNPESHQKSEKSEIPFLKTIRIFQIV